MEGRQGMRFVDGDVGENRVVVGLVGGIGDWFVLGIGRPERGVQ